MQPVVKVPFYAKERGAVNAPQTFQDASGVVHHALISPGRTELRVLQSTGQLDFVFKSPNYVQEVVYQPASDTYYVRSNTTIHALSGKDGSEMATISPDQANCLGKMTILSTGDLALVQGLEGIDKGAVTTLKPDLTPRWSRNIDMETNGVLDVGHGHMAVFRDGDDLAVLDASGNEVLRSKSPALYSPIVHDGHLMFIESHPSKWNAKYKEVVRYDSSTGEVRRTKVSKEADRIIPLPDGKFMLEDGGAGHPHISVYDADGERVKSFKFPDDRYARQLHVARDGKTALLVLGDTRYDLYKLDLEPQRSAWNLVGLSPAEHPEPILQRQGSFTPALLSNGQLAVFHSEGIELDGKRLGSTREFLQAVGPGVELDSDRLPMSYISVNERTRSGATLDQVLCDVESDHKLADALVTAPGNRPYITPDACLNFPLPALGAMPVAAHLTVADTDRVLRSLFREEATTLRVFGDATLELAKDKLTLTDGDGQQHMAFGAYTAALPLALGEKKFVAAVGQGDLVWLRPVKYAFAEERYNLGEPISGLELADNGQSVLVTTASGARLAFTPPGGAVVQNAEAPPPPRETQAGVHETMSTVQVGGVTIRKRRV